MRERELIEFLHTLSAEAPREWLKLGMGDDAAVARMHGQSAVITTDMLIEKTHYLAKTSPAKIGWKAIARCLSDLAAMAAEPLCTVAAVSFPPDAKTSFCRKMLRSLAEAAEKLSAPLIGGDISSGTDVTVLAVTAIGTPPPEGCVRRDTAQPGDSICVTGKLGESVKSGRHLVFTPRINEGREARTNYNLHAMIDISDGVSTDLNHICEASGLGATIHAGKMPISAEAISGEERQKSALNSALNEGEDYELLFCLPSDEARVVEEKGLAGTPVSVIGSMTAETDCVIVLKDGTQRSLRPGGWEHKTNET
ncbi:MAG: thiamine-phosphate kinase [Candidatus Brocadiia bacterium]